MTFLPISKPISPPQPAQGLGACAALPLLAGVFPKSALAQAISTALEQFPTLVPAQKGILTGAHWGAFEAIVEEGRMVRVQPVADDPAPTISSTWHRSRSTPEPHQVPHGAQELAGTGPGRQARAAWRRRVGASELEKAIALVAGEIGRVQRDFGPQAIHAGSYGWKSVGMFTTAAPCCTA